ncbi:serpin-ZX-like isoform X2 [Macadamia integrifolia]|uniref:serpin-ZX-like isoform X2 n=1 Tax=Macadamia integrifolia TaxID=60698 RepID=UPI001C4F54BA|nr:serpin-ZX-like isoform X2 [Macadamia integrifolia]
MDFRQSISSQTSFSLEIAKNVLLNEAKDSNIVFSPLSIHVVLSLIAAGSKGPTLDQMLSFLRSKSNGELNSFASEIVSKVLTDGSQSGGPRLSFANGVWMDKSLPLKASFKEIVDKVYKAVSMPVDFQAKAVEVANEVNLWAEKETNGLIKEVLPPGSVDSSTRLIFANALYFKGAWNENFDASKTKDYDFYLLDGSSVHVPFMTSKKKQYVLACDGFKVLRLPYKQGEDKRCFSMYFFLPDAKHGLPGLVEKVSSELGFLDRHLPSEAVKVGDFRIPRFKISFGFESSEVLKGLGLVLPFSGGLTETVDSPLGQNLFVSSIFHKSFIEVNEEGTEAAAASAAVMTFEFMRLPINVIDFVADHPFMYLIREEMTGVVLFIGHVLNPLQAA